jgi:hypothetical protein
MLLFAYLVSVAKEEICKRKDWIASSKTPRNDGVRLYYCHCEGLYPEAISSFSASLCFRNRNYLRNFLRLFTAKNLPLSSGPAPAKAETGKVIQSISIALVSQSLHSFLLKLHLVSFLLISPKTYLLTRSSISTADVVSVTVPPGFSRSPPPPGSILINLSPMRPEVLIEALASS